MFMQDEREVLTRDIIRKKLIYDAKRGIFNSLFLLFLSALFLGALYLISLKIIILVLLSIWAVGCLFFFVRAILRMMKAKRWEFTVDEDTLRSIHDDKFSWWRFAINFGNRYHRRRDDLEHVFEFKCGKKFVAGAAEYQNTSVDTAAKISFEGDKFFLVYYNDDPDRLIFIFSSKIYNYKQ